MGMETEVHRRSSKKTPEAPCVLVSALMLSSLPALSLEHTIRLETGITPMLQTRKLRLRAGEGLGGSDAGSFCSALVASGDCGSLCEGTLAFLGPGSPGGMQS